MESVIGDYGLSRSTSEILMVKLIETYPNVLISQDKFEHIQRICAGTKDEVAKKRKIIFNELLKIVIPKNDWSKPVSKPNFEERISACYGEYNNIVERVRLTGKKSTSISIILKGLIVIKLTFLSKLCAGIKAIFHLFASVKSTRKHRKNDILNELNTGTFFSQSLNQ